MALITERIETEMTNVDLCALGLRIEEGRVTSPNSYLSFIYYSVSFQKYNEHTVP